MEKKQVLSFNRQLSRMYSLAIANVMLSVAGLALNYFQFNHSKILYFAICLNVLGLIFFQPWKIMGCLNEGYGYQEGMNVLSKEKGVK
jgi:hypothetical protein